MKQLKYMLCKVMSRTLSLEKFAAWLYADEYITSRILDDEFIFELMSINFKNTSALHELEKLSFSNFDKDECLIEILRILCEDIIENHTYEEVETFLGRCRHFYDFDKLTAYAQFYWLDDDWDLAKSGYYSKNGSQNCVRTEILEYANKLLEALKTRPGIEVLYEGFELEPIPNFSSSGGTLEPAKKWYEFWKKG